MINWHDIHESSREQYAIRLAEAEHERFVRRITNTGGNEDVSTLRSRLARALVTLAYWLDSRTTSAQRYELERKEAF